MFSVWRGSVSRTSRIDELIDLAVRIAGDVDQRRFAGRAFVQAADGHDGKQLAQRPVIQQRLEHGEIAEVLVAEAVFELADFLRHIRLAAIALNDLLADFPVQVFDLGLVGQIEHSQCNMCCASSRLERVVVRLELVEPGEVLPDIRQFPHQRVLVLAVVQKLPQLFRWPGSFRQNEHPLVKELLISGRTSAGSTSSRRSMTRTSGAKTRSTCLRWECSTCPTRPRSKIFTGKSARMLFTAFTARRMCRRKWASSKTPSATSTSAISRCSSPCRILGHRPALPHHAPAAA